MELQINDFGSWRTIASFGPGEQVSVMHAAAGLLRSLHLPNALMRIVKGNVPSLQCAGPDYHWSAARSVHR